MTQIPIWGSLTIGHPEWEWHGQQLRQGKTHVGGDDAGVKSRGLGSFIVQHIYGRQNKSKNAKRFIREAIARLQPGQFGLNFGAGRTRYSPAVLNFDLMASQNVDVVSAGGLDIPFKDSTLNLIISQEVLEHVDRPLAALTEFHRVLQNNGELVLQLPFIIGYHPGPQDFWRFSTEAYALLLPSDKWQIMEKQITVGHGSGLHRILTEFVAVHFSIFGGKIYRMAKGVTALLISPLILFDLLTPYLPEKDRIAGGYIVRARVIK